ncbi:PAS domain-containing protein [Kordiimonas aestuarii]|uniref:PAS domain-containing protein n=1 Tax=Kordiimonas aestuarii TaxID=1005925 RepID=UPI0021D0643D|nr:PAS domain-containing protein [Kordiimonas aestuarii]
MVVTLGQTLLGTWQVLPRRVGQPLPFWQDIKAEHLTSVMRHVWVLEYAPPFHMYIKFMGTEVTRLGGRDTTSEDFLNTRIPKDQRPYMMEVYRTCYEDRCGVKLTRIVSPLGSNAKKLHTTFFPLAHEKEGRWMLLGCSRMESVGAAAIIDDSGTADYGTRQMQPPHYIDIGFGLPSLQGLAAQSA